MYIPISKSAGKVLLAGCIVGILPASLLAQSSSPSVAPPTLSTWKPISRIDIFAGYSYLAPHGKGVTTAFGEGNPPTTAQYSSVDLGALGNASYFFNKYVGAQVELGAHPDGDNDGFYSASGGLVARYPNDGGFTLFAHALGGAARIAGPNANSQSPYFAHAWITGPSITVGGGMDYELPVFEHHLALRLFQGDFEYMHGDWGPQPRTGGRANIQALRVSTGLVWKMGSVVPPPPVTFTCAEAPAIAFPGDPVSITGTSTNLDPKKTPTYTWSTQGATVKPDGPAATIDTSSLQPGDYVVIGQVSQGPKLWQSAKCTSNFTVKAYEPPALSCSADPTTLKPGDSSTITAQARSPQNRPLTYSYFASAGQVTGSTNTATLNTSGAPAGAITVTCNVSDDKGHSVSSTATVDVEVPALPPTPKTQTLCSVSFERDPRRPTRVDNEAKACLDDIALNAQRQPDAKLVVVGESASDEPVPSKHGKKKHVEAPENLAAERAVNTKAYFATEKGIDPARISVRTGTQGNKEVENYLVPAGANFDNDVSSTSPVDEGAVKPQPRKPLHTRRHQHRRKAGRHHHKARPAKP